MKRRLFAVLLLFSINVNAVCKTDLAAITAAGQSTTFLVAENRMVTLIFYAASGLSASEYGDIQISQDTGTTWQDLYASGSQVRMNSTNNAITIYGPGIFRVDKEVTTNATAVFRCRAGSL